MKIQPYIDKLNNSSEFHDFQEKHKDAFLVAGFFVIDLESGQNIHQIDYYVPSEKKVAAFSLDAEVKMQLLETMNTKTPEKLDSHATTDLDALKGILEDEMKNRSFTEDIRKIIAVIQNVDGKKVWNVNCVLSGMEILRTHVEDETQTVLKMEKASIMDYVKKLPGGMPMPPQNPGDNKESKETSSEALNDQIKKLDQLKAQLEKEQKELKKQEQDKE